MLFQMSNEREEAQEASEPERKAKILHLTGKMGQTRRSYSSSH